MTTITTYNTLVASVDGAAGWAHRTDITTRLPEFIALAEVDMQVRCKLVEFEAAGTVTITGGSGNLPADFVGMRSVYWDGDPDRPLSYITPEKFDALRGNDSGDGYYYTISGATIRTVPMGSGSVVMTYSARFTPITSSNQTNSLIANYPDVYLCGTLKQVALWAKDEKSTAKWEDQMDQAVARVISNNEARKYAGSTLQVRAR